MYVLVLKDKPLNSRYGDIAIHMKAPKYLWVFNVLIKKAVLLCSYILAIYTVNTCSIVLQVLFSFVEC